MSIIKKQPIPSFIHKNVRDYSSGHSHKINNSFCITEENRHVNLINPVNLADKDWTDPYKLNKLLNQ